MKEYIVIGKGIKRKEAEDKVTGAAKYTADYECAGLLHAEMVTSSYAHAEIVSIDASEALKIQGVKTVLSGRDYPYLTGSIILDRPVIASDRVRYFGEPVAVVVADTRAAAKRGADLVRVNYRPLAVVNSPLEAISRKAPILHERLMEYERSGEEAFPEPNSNIATRYKIRKGNMESGWAASEVVIESRVTFPQSDHAAMETRNCIVEIKPSGDVIIHSSTQGPFFVQEEISRTFRVPPGRVMVITPFVGGAYGAKTHVQLELIAYLCSQAAGGRPVKLVNTREQDMASSPVHIGLDSLVKLGCTRDGVLKAAEITHLFDGGAYSDRAVIITKAAFIDCTGPYNIPNVRTDSLCMYTNHPYATAFRGFGHSELTFAIERAMDILARKLSMDPLELRLKNALLPGHTTPTQYLLGFSFGNLPKCIERVSELTKWNGGIPVKTGSNRVTAMGAACFWKTTSMPTYSESGAIITFNDDGSVNLNCGIVEIGQGTKTGLAQILAEKLKIDVSMVHVFMEVNTRTAPDDWKTAASRAIFMCGRAVMQAADDAIRQLKRTASIPLRVSEEDLEVGGGRVFMKSNPAYGICIKDIALGYVYPNGNAVEGQVIGTGRHISKLVTKIDPETGKGKYGTEWTLGAQIVEVELDLTDYSYVIKRAASVIDIGKIINVKAAEGQVKGGMAMGLSFASREAFLFEKDGSIRNNNFRSYSILRFKENPEYIVDFIETPETDGPYGARGIGEHGVLGMPAALASAVSNAAGVNINKLPILPELIWRTVRETER